MFVFNFFLVFMHSVSLFQRNWFGWGNCWRLMQLIQRACWWGEMVKLNQCAELAQQSGMAVQTQLFPRRGFLRDQEAKDRPWVYFLKSPRHVSWSKKMQLGRAGSRGSGDPAPMSSHPVHSLPPNTHFLCTWMYFFMDGLFEEFLAWFTVLCGSAVGPSGAFFLSFCPSPGSFRSHCLCSSMLDKKGC